ncbi:MAG: hypothetical protein P8N76_13300 [Pirellulaceae bacterium]|nr:hypothetical protein [Pirellulaceae bacterium]
MSIIPQDAGMRDKTKYATIGSATSSAIKNATLPLILEAIPVLGGLAAASFRTAGGALRLVFVLIFLPVSKL